MTNLLKISRYLCVLAFGMQVGNAVAGDLFVGEWGGSCDGDIQCWIEIEKHSEIYDVRFVAADRFDASKVLCEVSSQMERGRVLYSPHESFDDALGGELQGSPAYVAHNDVGGIYLGGGLGAGFACGKYMMQGAYQFFGE